MKQLLLRVFNSKHEEVRLRVSAGMSVGAMLGMVMPEKCPFSSSNILKRLDVHIESVESKDSAYPRIETSYSIINEEYNDLSVWTIRFESGYNRSFYTFNVAVDELAQYINDKITDLEGVPY
jgi:hypothetical protein